MKFSVFTASLPAWPPSEAVEILASQGWDGVEWRVIDQDPAPLEPDGTPGPPGFWAGNRCTWPLAGLPDSVAELVSLTHSAGLAISALGGYAPSSAIGDVERLLMSAAGSGAGQVRVTMPAYDPQLGYRQQFHTVRHQLEQIVELAATHQVKALVELHHTTIVASAAAAWRLVDGLDPKAVGVIHDSGNLIIEGYEHPQAGFEMLGEYLAHVHVKNVAWVRDEQGWQWQWAPLREGVADLDAYFAALAAVGYDGWVTVEDFSTQRPLLERTADNLNYVRELASRAGYCVAAHHG